ncbi:MAG: cyclic nucleotide-binding domain-containing protein [Caldilineales bacterium]|nr:cyclic nucleotide-binding domain-containing protein [Caldilineales bacterium]
MTTLSYFKNSDDAVPYAAGTVIFEKGAAGDMMYAVAEGEVDIIVGGAAVAAIGTGEIFGEMALIDHSPRSATAVASTDCRLVAIDERRFQFLVQQNPFFALDVMRVLAKRLRTMNEIVT